MGALSPLDCLHWPQIPEQEPIIVLFQLHRTIASSVVPDLCPTVCKFPLLKYWSITVKTSDKIRTPELRCLGEGRAMLSTSLGLAFPLILSQVDPMILPFTQHTFIECLPCARHSACLWEQSLCLYSHGEERLQVRKWVGNSGGAINKSKAVSGKGCSGMRWRCYFWTGSSGKIKWLWEVTWMMWRSQLYKISEKSIVGDEISGIKGQRPEWVCCVWESKEARDAGLEWARTEWKKTRVERSLWARSWHEIWILLWASWEATGVIWSDLHFNKIILATV